MPPSVTLGCTVCARHEAAEPQTVRPLMHVIPQQRAICTRFGADAVPSPPDQKVGIALSTIGQLPTNALRHPVEGDACGWYIWCGEEFGTTSDFFQPIHVAHLGAYTPELIPYLALPPGWRVLLAPGYEDVWFDESLLTPAV